MDKIKEIITIQISKFLTNELAEKIAQKQWRSSTRSWINRSRQYIFDELVNHNDCFGVVAITSNNEVVGRLHCVKNENDSSLWYYGDLFVDPAYRRIGIAKQMVHATINHLSERGAVSLRCYVEPTNEPSRNLQMSMGFSEQPFEAFNDFMNDGEIMYEISIPSCLTFIPATVDEAYFVRILFAQNKDALNTKNISLNEWKELLSNQDPNEKHFLICKGAMPVAYMNMNGLLGTKEACIAMLFVAKEFQRQRIGTFALHHAEQYIKENGFASVSIRVPSNNLAAQSCVLKCGYQICEQNEEIRFCKWL